MEKFVMEELHARNELQDLRTSLDYLMISRNMLISLDLYCTKVENDFRSIEQVIVSQIVDLIDAIPELIP